MPRDSEDRHHLLAIGLLALAALARLLPHPANMTPLVAVALFGGAVLPRRLGLAVPLLAIIASDLALGLHDVVAFTWSGVLVAAMVGRLMVPRASRSGFPRPAPLALASVMGSTLFFIVSNFGVWLVGHSGTLYPHTSSGLAACFAAGLPFYRNALLGDLGWTFGLFGLYALASREHLLVRRVSH